jgi:hypothetical protein
MTKTQLALFAVSIYAALLTGAGFTLFILTKHTAMVL